MPLGQIKLVAYCGAVRPPPRGQLRTDGPSRLGILDLATTTISPASRTSQLSSTNLAATPVVGRRLGVVAGCRGQFGELVLSFLPTFAPKKISLMDSETRQVAGPLLWFRSRNLSLWRKNDCRRCDYRRQKDCRDAGKTQNRFNVSTKETAING